MQKKSYVCSLPEIWISGGQMSGEDDGTGVGSSVQTCKKRKRQIKAMSE